MCGEWVWAGLYGQVTHEPMYSFPSCNVYFMCGWSHLGCHGNHFLGVIYISWVGENIPVAMETCGVKCSTHPFRAGYWGISQSVTVVSHEWWEDSLQGPASEWWGRQDAAFLLLSSSRFFCSQMTRHRQCQRDKHLWLAGPRRTQNVSKEIVMATLPLRHSWVLSWLIRGEWTLHLH